MHLKKEFYKIFNEHPKNLYFSPGRVNLIGEHIDYNGGLVFPAAISLGTYAAFKTRSDSRVRIYSKNFTEQGIIEFSINDLTYQDAHHFANYIKGVMEFINQKYHVINDGFDLYIEGTLPPQSGLSSSASLLVLIMFIFNDVYQLNISKTDMALYAQHVENNYMGMHCGIMDQLIIAKGVKDKALLMNTKTYETTPVNAFFEGFTWIIINTNYQRKTTDSKYNERVKECQDALKIINTYKEVSYLCDISIDEYKSIDILIKDPILRKRAKHVITEQQRVLDSKNALLNKDATLFGKLLIESHQSLKNDYEVTGLNLDALVDGALLNGAIGARVTGAGFGGCAIALVPNHLISSFEKQTNLYYKQHTGIDASFYQVNFVDGVRKLEDSK